jgi:VWFA-related protein
MNHKPILALLVSFCVFLSAVAQTKPSEKPVDDQDDVVKITTNLVQIDAVVTKNRKPVTNLRAEDFEIYEDGKLQTITSFAFIPTVPATPPSPEKTEPNKTAPDKTETSPKVPAGPIQRESVRRTIAIVVDDLGMSAGSMSLARGQLRKLVNEKLYPDDLIAIIRTSGEIGALQQFTTDREVLNRAVGQLRWNVCSRVGASVLSAEHMATRTGFPYSGNTQIREPYGSACNPNSYANTRRAVHLVLDAMANLPGRKSLIMMSDDMPIYISDTPFAGSDYSAVGQNVQSYSSALQKIAEKAIRASVVIYAVDTQGLQYTGLTAADSVYDNGRGTPVILSILKSRSATLQRRSEGGELIARQTGGFQLRYSNDYFDRILKDQTGYYLIGYRPTQETFNRKFHHITAKVKQSGLTVRTRAGFFGVTEEEAARVRPSAEDQTNLALLSPFAAKDLELNLTSFFTSGKTEGGKTEGSLVRSFIYLNAKNLTFAHVNDRYQTSIELHGAVFGDNGAVVEQLKLGATLNLRKDEYEQALRDSLNLRLDLPVKKPGSYQVRIAVRDEVSSKIGSAGESVAVPDLKKRHLAISGIVLRRAQEPLTPTTVMANPGIRRFAANSDLHFAFLLYNAAINPATRLPDLVMETSLFRDGQRVGTETETAVSAVKQEDLGRLFTTGMVKLDQTLEPGSYYLQVVITDKAARNQQPPITQWVDFEIVNQNDKTQ